MRGHAVLLQIPGELGFDLADQIAVALRQRIQPLHHHRMGFRIERAERKVLELLPHLLHAHAAGERRIDVEGFLGDAAAGGRRHELQRAHVVQTVGQLDQENANVIGDRQQQLAQVFRLLGLARNQFQPLQLGEALDQRADFMAEDLVDFGAGGLGVLDGVVQQRGDDGGVVELEVGEDRRDFQRMRKIGIAGGAGLGAMRLHGVDIGAVQHVLVGVRGCRTGPARPDHIAASCASAAWPAWSGLGRVTRGRRHGDRIGRGLHLPGIAAPNRHRITAFVRAVGCGPPHRTI